MDAAAHYRHLATLGRDEFLAAAAPAVLVRARTVAAADLAMDTQTFDHDLEALAALGEDIGETDVVLRARVPAEPGEMELYPLSKKPGASFPDRITIGRTPNNDVVIADASVSRLHAYVRQASGWLVADAGSKNGSWLDDAVLEPRREAVLAPGAVIRLGDVSLTFQLARDLFDILGGDR